MGVGERVTLRPFQVDDQDAAKQLVLTGLGERWGWIDPALNPDLDDIATTYAAGYFLVGYLNNELVATGALLPEVDPAHTGNVPAMRVVRMSVRADLRGQGIGRRVLDALLAYARSQDCRLLVLETTSTWTDAVRFYTRYGFQFIAELDGETHMQLEVGDV